jgi:hypothetical protein
LSSLRSSMPFVAAAALAVALGVAGTPAQATLANDGSAERVAVERDASTREVARDIVGDVHLDKDLLTRAAFLWSGSNGGDDRPNEDRF